MSRSSKTRFGVLSVLGVGFVLGYVVACSNTQPTESVEAGQDDNTKANEEPNSSKKLPSDGNSDANSKSSPVKPVANRGVYYPGTEELKPDEMRVICIGSGMPMPRLKQAAAGFLIELGNGDKFIFDMGTGSMHRLYALGIQLDYLDKVFLSHLHMDQAGDLPACGFGGMCDSLCGGYGSGHGRPRRGTSTKTAVEKYAGRGLRQKTVHWDVLPLRQQGIEVGKH